MDLFELVSDGISGWMDAHPHSCHFFVFSLLLLVFHLYRQLGIVRRVIGMRKGDAFYLAPPRPPQGTRRSWLEELLLILPRIVWTPKATPHRAPRHEHHEPPADPSAEPTPKD